MSERKTGIVYTYRRESERLFHGGFDTRHEAVGYAAIVGRITGEETYVRPKLSIWREMDDPVVCDYCGEEEYYLPIIGWTFVTDDNGGRFCSDQCYARWAWENEPSFLEVADSRNGGEDQ